MYNGSVGRTGHSNYVREWPGLTNRTINVVTKSRPQCQVSEQQTRPKTQVIAMETNCSNTAENLQVESTIRVSDRLFQEIHAAGFLNE